MEKASRVSFGVEHNHVGCGRAAVNARKEMLVHGFWLRCPGRLCGQVEALAEGFQPRGELPRSRDGVIRLDFKQRNMAFRFQLGVFKAVIITEFDRVVDNAANMLVFVQCPPRRDIGHAHAGRLAEQRARVPVHQFFKGEIGGLLRRFFQRAQTAARQVFTGMENAQRICPKSWGLTRAPSTAINGSFGRRACELSRQAARNFALENAAPVYAP